MKILQVITSLRIGGAEKLITDMVPLFREEGHQVDVLLFDGVETPFKKQLEEQGIRIFSFNVKGSVYNPVYIFKLMPIIKQYDIVHTHNTACQYFVALAKYRSRSRVKLVTTEHSTNNRRRSNPLFKYMDRFIYNQYNVIVAISEKTARLLSEYLLGKAVQVVLNGVDLSSFKQAQLVERKEMGITDQTVLITMVARFAEAKDQETVIKAIALLPSNYSLLLVGGGDYHIQRQCQQLVKGLGLEGRVCFAGIRCDIPQILKTSDLIVMSSHWEGLSLSSIEGMSVGKPFVASDVNGLHEITEGAGLLFPHKDEKALATILKRLMEDQDYYRRIADRCMQRASEYDIWKTVAAYLEIYKLLV